MSEEKQPVRVAVGIIVRDGKILCCQRRRNARYGLQWEFPGGKLHDHESPESGLTRELREELNIDPNKLTLLTTRVQSYPDDGLFEVHYYIIDHFTGEPVNRAFESIRWTLPSDLDTLPFLEGNKPLLPELRRVLHDAKG
jgi:8-oxo-dGTP diphosphatase